MQKERRQTRNNHSSRFTYHLNMLRQAFHELTIPTRGRGLCEFTSEVERWVEQNRFQDGLLTLHLQHTSASLLIQENADPSVLADLESFFARIAPEGGALYAHDSEGPDDMPAHIRAALTQTHLAIPLVNGALTLGVWQGVFLIEHRRRPHRREIALHLIGA